MTERKPFWTIGREREKAHIAEFLKRAAQQELIFPLVDAALDINEGVGDATVFAERARAAMIEGDAGVWQNAVYWIGKAVRQLDQLNKVWNELASHPDWRIRWRVACVLYSDITEEQSNELFAVLRHDRSAKVRQYAKDRYENRPGPDRQVIYKMFDADSPSSPGFKGGH